MIGITETNQRKMKYNQEDENNGHELCKYETIDRWLRGQHSSDEYKLIHIGIKKNSSF